MTKKKYTACNQNLMVLVLQAPSAQPAIYYNERVSRDTDIGL